MDVSTLSALYAEGKRPRDLAPRVHGACAELGAAFVTLCSLEDLESACEAAERVAADARCAGRASIASLRPDAGLASGAA